MSSENITAAKLDRSKSKGIYTRSIKRLARCLESETDIQLIDSRFQEVQENWRRVQDAHEAYVSLLESDDPDLVENEEKWIEEEEMKFDDIERKKFGYVLERQEQTNAKLEEQRREELEREERKKRENMTRVIQHNRHLRELERVAFDEEAKNVEIIIHEESKKEKPNQKVYEEALKDLKEQFDRCKRSNIELMSSLAQEDVGEEITWMSEVQTNFNVLKRKLNDMLGQLSLATHEDKILRTTSKFESGLKLERMKLPFFTGQIRDYPRFKADFVKQVLPEIPNKNKAAYALKSCLNPVALEKVKNIDDDIDDMWLRLDEIYGRASKMIDVVMYDIKKLRPIKEGEDKLFIELVDIVERGYYDLKRIGAESEISNASTVSTIEERLPSNIKRHWSVRVSKKGSSLEETNKFPLLLDFLLEQRRAIEYETMDIRGVSSKHVSFHIDGKTEEIDEEDNDTNTKERKWQYHKCWLHQTNTHDVESCKTFMDKSPEEKIKLIRENRACWSCLRKGHRSAICRYRKQCGIDNCTMHHHESLHEAHISGVNFHSTLDIPDKEEDESAKVNLCLLQLMKIDAEKDSSKSVTVLWDNGATLSLITFKAAEKLNLIGKPRKISVIKVGGVKEDLSSYVYDLPLYDRNGEVVNFKVYGIDQISTSVKVIDINGVRHFFSDAPFMQTIQRPHGDIDVLVGFEYAGFHPVRKESKDHLLLLENRFGQCIGGSHPMLEESAQKLVNHIVVHHMENVKLNEFFETENLGIQCTPRCGSCKCGKCPPGGKDYTLKEERELTMIEQGLELSNGQWNAKYPWIKDPRQLPDNKPAALGRLKSTERRLMKNTQHAIVYQQQMKDMEIRGVSRKLTENEMKEYKGPIHYISHHEVLKPESSSTPCRIVFNTSAKYCGHVLNDYWGKGPDIMNNLFGVIMRFREETIAVMGDIRKMYHAVKISPLDQHTHRFLWRDLDQSKPPETYVMTSVSFGDRPAGSIATVALRKTAKMNESKYPEAAKTILDNTYVDDVLDSVKDKQEALKLTSNIDSVLESGGFSIKSWVISDTERKDTDERQRAPLDQGEQKVLGINWDKSNDKFFYKAKLNFSPKRRNIRCGPDLGVHQLPKELPTGITKRMILSQVNGIYDPLGLATPYVVKAKLMMRRLWTGEEKSLGWDDPIPEELRCQWGQFFKELFAMEDISFERCIKPKDAVGKPTLVLFSDGSEGAYGTCAYARWNTTNGKIDCNLLAAKSRLAPVRKITIVRLELNGAVLAKRLKETIAKESRLIFEKTYFLVDSEVVKAMIQKESYGFNTFAGVRIGEIQSATDQSQWYWVEGKKNIADWTTRGKSPNELGPESSWQKGPDFLYLPEKMWPTKKDCVVDELPEQASVLLIDGDHTDFGIGSLIDISRFSNYDKLMRVTARIISIFKGNANASLGNLKAIPTQELMSLAEKYWIADAQKGLKDKTSLNAYNRLAPRKLEDNTVVVGSRASKWVEISHDKKELPLIPGQHPFAKLFASKVHNDGHLSINTTVAKVRLNFWITRLRQIVSGIRYKCIPCRKLDKKLQNQIMGDLPDFRLKPAPAWNTTGIDFFGPFQIRGEVNKRSRGKCFGVLFNDLVCRAVHVDLSQDYSTDGLLMVLRRFVALRGYPSKIFSDSGSQLVNANKELKDMIESLDKDTLARFGHSQGLQWQFSSPDAPWQNGCTEALVKLVKKALVAAIGDQVLSFSELQTVLYEAANLVNERPIGVLPTHPEDGSYLSPNHLLLGRASSRIPSGPFKDQANMRQRFGLVQSIIDSFWKRMTRDFFPSLLIRTKWHVQKRNVKVNDLVMVQDSNLIRGDWRLGRVVEIYPDDKGVVRNVEVEYKLQNPDESPKVYKSKPFSRIRRAVQRLVVVMAAEEMDD